MPSVNKVILLGHLGRDAELRYLANGTAKVEFSLATSRNYKKGDEWKDEVEWSNVVVWGDAGERFAQYGTKGTLAYVEGRIQTRNWTDDQGVKHYRTEIIADRVASFTKKGDGKPESNGGWDDTDPDDLPFE